MKSGVKLYCRVGPRQWVFRMLILLIGGLSIQCKMVAWVSYGQKVLVLVFSILWDFANPALCSK